MQQSILVKNQSQDHTVEGFRIDGGHGKLVIHIRYDDKCGNGTNYFAITASMYRDGREWGGGCLHDDIKAHAPKLAHLIKWHLMSSNEPMHYVSNTIYHAQDTDCNGYKKGEHSAFKTLVISDHISEQGPVTIYTSGQMYFNNQNNSNLEKCNDKETLHLNKFTESLKVPYQVVKVNSPFSISEGKDSDINAARRSAIWHDATIDQLLSKKALTERLPSLRLEFVKMIESLGMVY
jgi:hypothetical protein